MRLSHIKLAGFKSFVDPTTIPVPGQLVAVCGPNGCGKSNVIDAVRWVLGESSAKQLRGESMQDVIFNGSTTRKAVSRTAVELVFDNRAGLAAGAWSAYAEISIKRVLTRQGESSYFINNQAVRRRDITDLFLGTGVGKSGYAIIEQGMISRIIEAKPEELRHYLEEAAGVSKYKERRRETENRIADTRDNLARVADIRFELHKQIEHLSAQASVATQYQELQQQIAVKQSLLAMQRKLDAEKEHAAAATALAQAQTALAASIAGQRECEAQLEILRETHFSASDALHAAQGELFAANGEVARLEQTLLHHKQTRERINQQLTQCENDLARLDESRNQMQAESTQLTEQLDELHWASEESMLQVESASMTLPDHEQEVHSAELAWQSLKERVTASQNQLQLAEQQQQFAMRHSSTMQRRLAELEIELSRLAPPIVSDELELQAAEIQLALEELQIQLEDEEAALLSGAQTMQLAQDDWCALQSQMLQLTAREAALADVLHSQGDDAQLDEWLQQWAATPALAELLQVDSGWELALESVLGARLQGRVLNVPVVPPASLYTIQIQPESESIVVAPRANSLLSKIRGDTALLAALGDVLNAVICVENLDEIRQQQAQLGEGILLVSKDGHVATRYTLHYFAADAMVQGLLLRQAEWHAVQAQLAELEPLGEAAKARSDNATTQQQHRQSELSALREQLIQHENRLLALTHQQHRQHDQQRFAAERCAALQQEQHNLESQLQQELLVLQAAEQQAATHRDGLQQLQMEEASAKAKRDGVQQTQSAQSRALRELELAAQQAQFAVQSAEQKKNALVQRMRDNEAQRLQGQARQAQLLTEREAGVDLDLDASVQHALTIRAEKERELAVARDALNTFAQNLREQESAKQTAEQGVATQRETVNQTQLAEQEARLNLTRYCDELAELNVIEADLLPQLGRSVKTLAAEITRLGQQLSGLGAVNLAALAELNAASERQDYLAAQMSDLEQAMATLESAIARIDKETRQLLQSTYQSVNANLQELFPALFGGGHAELILTGDEILDSGMSIMAQPPGKKNATIHLLSGGEKALTALSLVFSLFKLNPAPFCLLDEVDAPLDDANTLRFCELVKKMALHTQFLYISHNKLTMEMAQQLVGVTMQEQGVSRIVAVDIAEALKMREPELM